MVRKSIELLSFHMGLVVFTSLCSAWAIINKFMFWMVASGHIIFSSVIPLKIVCLISLLLLGYVSTSRSTVKILYGKKSTAQTSIIILLLTITALVMMFFAGLFIQFYDKKLAIENLAVFNLENFEKLRLNRLLVLIAPSLFILVLYYRLLPQPHSFQRINLYYLVNSTSFLIFPVHGYLLFFIALIPGEIGGIPAFGTIFLLAMLFAGSYYTSAAMKEKSLVKMLLFWIMPIVLSISSILEPSLHRKIDPVLELILLSGLAMASVWLGFRKKYQIDS